MSFISIASNTLKIWWLKRKNLNLYQDNKLFMSIREKMVTMPRIIFVNLPIIKHLYYFIGISYTESQEQLPWLYSVPYISSGEGQH